MYTFGAVIRKDEDCGFWAEVPQLEGCYGEGSSFSEAVQSIADGLETHIAAMLEYGIEVPKPERTEAEDGEVVYIAVNPTEYTLKTPSVTSAEAARMLNISPGRVSQLIKAGTLQGTREVGRTLVTVDSVKRYANSPRTAGRPKAIA